MMTRENLLDWLHSFGRDMKYQMHPSAHPYDDAERARPYRRHYANVRQAWARVHTGDDPVEVMEWLLSTLTGIESNHVRLVIRALKGELEKTAEEIASIDRGHVWLTYGGDFYSVMAGDRLNLPRVNRVANQYLPKELRRVDGSRAVADMLQNPCTRITAPAQAN